MEKIFISIFFFLTAIILFCSWAMDSVKFRLTQAPEWLKNFNDRLYYGWFSLNKDHYKIIPSAFCDAWHFFKMILVGAVLLMASMGIYLQLLYMGQVTSAGEMLRGALILFVVLSMAWNVVWYVIYDRKYRTGK